MADNAEIIAGYVNKWIVTIADATKMLTHNFFALLAA